MKFLREITPFFKKTMSLADIGWDDQGNSFMSSPPTSPSTQLKGRSWSNTKKLPLKFCYVCQNLSLIDKDNCIIELHAPDGQSSCFFKCPDQNSANSWFNAINFNVVTLLHTVGLAETNKALSKISSNTYINHMGWLAQQVSI